MKNEDKNKKRQEYHGNDHEENPSGLGIQVLGVTACMFGIGAILFYINGQYNDSLLFSGILFTLLGATMYTFGKIIPYIVSIATDLRALKEETRMQLPGQKSRL